MRCKVCRNYTEQITPAIDNRLSEELKESLFMHLNVCSQCNAEYHLLLTIKTRLGRTGKATHTPDQLFQFIKTLPQQKQELSKISSNDLNDILKPEAVVSTFSDKMNSLKIIIAITLSFITVGYYLLFS